MQVRYEKVGRTDKNRTTKKMREPIDKAYYICQTYNRMGKDACTSHKIEARALTDLVLKDIQELAKEAMKDADAFYNRLVKRMEKQYRTDFTELKKEYGRLQNRNEEIDGIIGSLYADKSRGILSEKRFVKMLSDLESEQTDNEARMQDVSKHLNESDAQDGDIRLFIEEIRKVGVIRELDEALLNRLIDRIFIGETIKTDQGKVQEVRIVYNFVGEVSGDAK